MHLITVAEAAARVSLSTRTINRMLDDGRLTRFRLDGSTAVRIDAEQLDALFIPQDTPAA